MEGRRSANVIAQGQRGTSAALGHAVAMGKPCKGAIELDARGSFALAGLHGSPAGTQGCARSSLTLGYYIAGLSALSLDQLSVTPLDLWVMLRPRRPPSLGRASCAVPGECFVRGFREYRVRCAFGDSGGTPESAGETPTLPAARRALRASSFDFKNGITSRGQPTSRATGSPNATPQRALPRGGRVRRDRSARVHPSRRTRR